jgi:diguanylate cyclase (GGDEF)-like protein
MTEQYAFENGHKRLRDSIEASIADWRTPIPSELKQGFLEFQYQNNLKFIQLMNLVGFTMFLLYGLADWFLLGDVGQISILVRCVLYVTLLPATLWFIRQSHDVGLLELLLPASTVVGTIFWFELLLRAQSQHIASYIYAGIIFVVFPSLGIRTWFSAALGYVAFISVVILLYAFKLSGAEGMAWKVYQLALLPFVLISLFIAWHNTYTSRRLFLSTVIEGLTKEELKKANLQLITQSQTDFLTGLPNRYLLSDRVQQLIAKANRDNTRFAVIYVDLDRFKPINDTYGHAVGDALLRDAAARMVQCVRESDTVARIGGDEFVVLLPMIEDHQHAKLVAEKIRDAVNQAFMIGDIRIAISSSLGIAIYPEHGKDADALSMAADLSLYRAKELGRNRVEMNP